MLPSEYVREAYKRGLAYEAKLGANPFKFGLIGSTDSHTALSTTEENNFFGKVSPLEPSADPMRFDEVIAGRTAPKGQQLTGRNTAAAGLAAVWARENTREAIWDAFARKEVFATTGTRLKVRVFGGFGFEPADLDRSDFAKHGYANGVPMGGDLTRPSTPDTSPSFLVRAIRDADGANLDRVQIIKGWLDKDGKTQEKVYDLAVSDGRTIGDDGRCKAPVGNTVNVQDATYSNSIGDPFLQAYWKDPEFDAQQRAFYYVRVLEIPTPRWTTFDAKVFGVKLPTDVPATSKNGPIPRPSGTRHETDPTGANGDNGETKSEPPFPLFPPVQNPIPNKIMKTNRRFNNCPSSLRHQEPHPSRCLFVAFWQPMYGQIKPPLVIRP